MQISMRMVSRILLAGVPALLLREAAEDAHSNRTVQSHCN